MNGNELIKDICEKTGLDPESAAIFLRGFEKSVAEALGRGEEVKLHGFGRFGVRTTKARASRNPKTGESIVAEATARPYFRFGEKLSGTIAEDFKKREK